MLFPHRTTKPGRNLPRLRPLAFSESTFPIILLILLVYPLLVGLVFFSSGLLQDQRLDAAVGAILSDLVIIGAVVGIFWLYGLSRVIVWVVWNVAVFVHVVSGCWLVIHPPPPLGLRNADSERASSASNVWRL